VFVIVYVFEGGGDVIAVVNKERLYFFRYLTPIVAMKGTSKMDISFIQV
jgi:hypothetical protein